MGMLLQGLEQNGLCLSMGLVQSLVQRYGRKHPIFLGLNVFD